jgi:hypothetical protein
MSISTVIEREVYAELGTLAAAYRIEARRHFAPALRDLLEDGARIFEGIRHDYWTARTISEADALALYWRGRAMLEVVAGWDA